MRTRILSGLMSVVALLFACAVQAFAGPPFPCVEAASSSDGSFLVLTDIHPRLGQTQIARIQDAEVILQVLPKEPFINARDRLDGPATYWTHSLGWSIALDASRLHDEPQCPLPMITNDGQFLILLRTGPVFDGFGILHIFHREGRFGRQGVLVKDISINQVWPTDKIADSWDDGTPQWFAGGTFEFSADSQQLIHKTRWGNTVRINLADGSVSRTDRVF